ncbi:O-antigen ligase family protein [Dialister sp.]|uniref:O-antigen ligase family protein n=1 Tax=Dialister sp. TaxID=1955814 RepID=UPI003F0F03A6
MDNNKIYKTIPELIALIMTLLLTIGYKFSLWSKFALAVIVPFILIDIYFNHKKIKLSINKHILWGFIIFSILIILAGAVNKDWLSIRKAYKYITYAAPFFICIYLMERFDVNRGIRIGIACSMIVLCGSGIYQWYILHDSRIIGIFETPNALGMTLELMVPFSISFVVLSREYYFKIFWGLISIVALVCIYLTGSRGSVFGFVGGAFATYIIYLFKYNCALNLKQRGLALVAGIIILIMGGIAMIGVNSYRSNATGGERKIMIESSYHMWQDHKFSGVGMAHWKENYYGQYRPEGQHEKGLDMPHNLIIFYMSTTGIIGVTGFGIYILFTLLGMYKIVKNDIHVNYVHAAGICIFCGFVVIHGLVDGTIINTNISKIFYLLLGYAISLNDIKNIIDNPKDENHIREAQC